MVWDDPATTLSHFAALGFLFFREERAEEVAIREGENLTVAAETANKNFAGCPLSKPRTCSIFLLSQ
jgi:hypothetical protein